MRKLILPVAVLVTFALAVPASADVSAGEGLDADAQRATAITGRYRLVDRGVQWDCEAISTAKGTTTGDLPAATSVLECSFYVDATKVGDTTSSDPLNVSVAPGVVFPIADGSTYTICMQGRTLFRDNTTQSTNRVCFTGLAAQSPSLDTAPDIGGVKIDRSDTDALPPGN